THLLISRNFLASVILEAGATGPYGRLMTGQITLSQLVTELDEDCKKAAAAAEIFLPEKFSVAQIFGDFLDEGRLNTPLLDAAVTLRKNGFKTCVLTNNWIDDSLWKGTVALILPLLRRHFDLVIESCRIGLQKPDPKIYEYALRMLEAEPHEVIFLDDIGTNLKPAREMGIATILFRDLEMALKELQDLSGVQLLGEEEGFPTACDPASVSHGYVPVKPGVQLHFVEMGHGPVVCLCHGFPESWFSWRYQIPALADAGFRVIALDMKGYGDSSAPPDIKEYSQEEICKVRNEIVAGIFQTVFIGHDWGGSVVWNMSLFYPERVKAVASLNTPYKSADPNVDIMEAIKAHPAFDYQLFFQKPGVAEAELEEDLARTFKIMIRSIKKQVDGLPPLPLSAGGVLVGLPKDPPPSLILPEPDLQYYIQQYKKSGFRGPLNWYRNMQTNWSWRCSARGRKVRAAGVALGIPQLTRGHIEECGHWTQMERPAALNKILIKWLEDIHSKALLQRISRL
uniref:Epoxide hydrolase 2 n=1 Tax=Crocodylus porosus TaxID=8502 RepID=A0A7M4E5D6_CROPO